MNVPEIRDYVGQFLNRSALAKAASVCKEWNATFEPRLYRNIVWNQRLSERMSYQTLKAKAGLVRALNFRHEPSIDFPLELFTRLIAIRCSFDVFSPSFWDRFWGLLLQNLGLATLVMPYGGQLPPKEILQGLATHCPRLRTFQFWGYRITVEETEDLLDMCVQLEELRLNHTYIADVASMDKWAQFPHIKDLHLSLYPVYRINRETNPTLSMKNQLELIRMCPQLKSLFWGSPTSKAKDLPLLQFCELAPIACPKLEKLAFGSPFSVDEDLARVLDSFPKVTSFSLQDAGFGSKALRSLGRHISHLTRLNIRKSAGSALNHQVLTTCHRLIHLSMDALDAQHIVGGPGYTGMECDLEKLQPQDWVCTSLQVLQVFICGLEFAPTAWHQIALTQLARLKQLEELDLGRTDEMLRESADVVEDGIWLRIDEGLDTLGSLKRMNKFHFDGLKQVMDEDEVSWMLRSWPALEEVTGRMHYADKRRMVLETMLMKHGVKVAPSAYFVEEDY